MTDRNLGTPEALLTRPLTVAELRQEAGCSNASALVTGLNARGFDIVSVPVEVEDRDGAPCRTALYHLMGPSRRAARKALKG